MDQALVDTLVGHSCHRVQSMAEDGQCCTYRIDLSDSELSSNVPNQSVLSENASRCISRIAVIVRQKSSVPFLLFEMWYGTFLGKYNGGVTIKP